MAQWTEDLEDLPRLISQKGFSFYSPVMARRGDTWSNPSGGITKTFIIERVTKVVTPEYSSIDYVIEFSNGDNEIQGINIPEGLGMGTFYVG